SDAGQSAAGPPRARAGCPPAPAGLLLPPPARRGGAPGPAATGGPPLGPPGKEHRRTSARPRRRVGNGVSYGTLPFPPRPLPLQPQRSSTTAVVEALVGGIVLHIRLPGGGNHTGVRIHVVLLLGFIALKRKNDLPACLQVLGAPLFLEHGRDLGVVDVASVE